MCTLCVCARVCERGSSCASGKCAPGRQHLKQNQGTCVCVCLRLHVCLYSGAYVCARVSQCACVCILVCMREGWGIWPPICARLFRYCFCRHTHTDTVTHTYTHTHCGALCQASCSLAGAGNAPERVVASICSTGERLGCV